MSNSEQVDVAVAPEVDDDGPISAGWYPEPGDPERKRYWDGQEWGERWREPKVRPAGKANRLAVTALICSCVGPIFVGGILATVFGLVALDEIEEADGAERGQGIAKWAIGVGFVNIILSGVAVVGLVILLAK